MRAEPKSAGTAEWETTNLHQVATALDSAGRLCNRFQPLMTEGL